MAIDCGAITEGFKFLCVPLFRQIGYIKDLHENMTRLRTKMDALTSKAEDITIEVNNAELHGKTRRKEVSNWLDKVRSIEEQVSNIEKKLKEQNKCWDGCMPNYYLRRKISRMSLKLIIQADELFANCNFENVAFEQQAVLGCTLPTTSIASKTTADETLDEILDCILNTEMRIIGVHGMGGVGKTTIMMNINNRLMKTNDFDDIIWITVSKDVDMNKLQRKIAKKLDLDLKEGEDDVDVAKAKIFNTLERRKKFLLIFDDMWDYFPLDQVGIPHPSEENGCKIVLTTRDLRVCRAMGAHAVKAQVLSDEESWELFKKNAGDVVLSSGIEELAKAVTRECCHLPLAIVIVGKAMCGVNDVRVWKNALTELQQSSLEVEGMDDVFVQLKFSYTRLRNSELKSCFLYCSLYPEDCAIYSRELIEYWICEGIIDKRETIDDNMNKGHAILDELIKVSMLGLVESGENDKIVRMHDLIRDMAIRITRTEAPRSMINAGIQLKESPFEWPTDAERISLMENDIKVLSGQPNCHHLLTLLLQENPLEKIIPHSYFNHMCSLRVLDLSWTRIKALPESISNLKNLRALLLQHCHLEEVPSLSNLEELRVLDLSETAIRELPPGMEAMVKLQRLNLNWTEELRVFPIGIIPRLSFLEELTVHGSGWKWSSMTTEGARIEEIVNSTQLAKLEIDFTDLSSFLSLVNSGNWQMMKNFRLCVGSSFLPFPKPNFCVQINRCNLIGEDNSLLLPYKTQWLQINSCEIISLWNVTRSLNTSELCGCHLYSCKKMEFLMADEEPLLPDLKELKMEDMPELLALCKGIPSLDALKSLESLEVSDCHNLKYLLPARLLQQLRCLKHINVWVCDGMEEIVAEEEEMEKGKNEDKSTLSLLQTLRILQLPNLKSISSRVLICNALETVSIKGCRQLKKLPFCVHNLPSALKQIVVRTDEKEWWDTLVWDHPQTQAHFQSLVQFTYDF